MSNGKVTLPREVAEAITHYRKYGVTNRKFIEIANGDSPIVIESIALYASENYDAFLSALVNGFDFEKSPEEKVREYYRELITEGQRDLFNGRTTKRYSMAGAVRRTVSLLGITIEGVND